MEQIVFSWAIYLEQTFCTYKNPNAVMDEMKNQDFAGIPKKKFLGHHMENMTYEAKIQVPLKSMNGKPEIHPQSLYPHIASRAPLPSTHFWVWLILCLIHSRRQRGEYCPLSTLLLWNMKCCCEMYQKYRCIPLQ